MATENTFVKEITFINPAFYDEETQAHTSKEVTVSATFKDLSRTDRTQHDLHFMIMAAFEETKGNSVKYDSSQLLKMIDEFVETAMLTKDGDPNTAATNTDKLQFLNDSIGKLKFGFWLMKEKFSPFFAQLAKT